MHSKKSIVVCLFTGACFLGTPAYAQEGDYEQLIALGDSALEDELTARYDAGLALTNDRSVISADDPRYLWALETKVQCGIALGFMESSTRDETSIRNCNFAYLQMNYVAPQPVASPPVAPPPPRRLEGCDDEIVGIVFFEFDSAVVSSDAGETLTSVVGNIRECGWSSLTVVGHTDQAGSNAYNDTLSEERANAVTAALRSRGATLPIETRAEGESNPRVPLPDGTRSPQNRRVEISAD